MSVVTVIQGDKPTLAEAFPLWLKIGCTGFGGPSAQIAQLHAEVVETRGWVGEQEFLRALQFCMLLPGPEAQQLAIYLGWKLHGIRGGVIAGILFVLPAALLIWLLALLYVTGRDWPLLMAFFAGLKPAVVAIVFSACLRIGKKTITTGRQGIMAITALLLLSFTSLPYPLLVLGFSFLGALFLNPQESALTSATLAEPITEPLLKSDWKSSLGVFGVVCLLWVLPIFALFLWLGPKALPVKVGLFFAKVAVVSFGGAYAALSYVSLHAAGDWGWVTSGEMMDGLGLAETTPGPLLIALQFVAFLAAYKTPGLLAPLVAATLASLAALWSLFLPSFLWIFSLAPHMERLGRISRVAGALAAIGAVVTAVILHLALWFAGNLFFPHAYGMRGGVAWVAFLMSLAAFLLLESKRLGMIPVILLSGLAALLLHCLGGVGAF